MVRSIEIELEGCNSSSCEDHPEREWLVLEKICNHLGSNLKEMVVHLSIDWTAEPDPWIAKFARDIRGRGITICSAWKLPDESVILDYHCAASTSESSLVKLMTRTFRGKSQEVRIWGNHDVALSISANVFETLSNLAEDGLFDLHTNIKIKSMDNLEHLKNCLELGLHNSATVEDEEVVAMERILAQVAMDPRPRNPQGILLPKVITHIWLPTKLITTHTTHLKAFFYEKVLPLPSKPPCI